MKNRGPEKDITEPLIRRWLFENGFDVTVVETKAVFSKAANRYLRPQASESLPDLVGNKGPLSVWIELKAPKKRYNLSDDQRNFLERKINQGCFACVTDCPNHLDRLWKEYKKAEDKIAFLLSDIPVKKKPSLKPFKNMFKQKIGSC